ncbi:MAG TPA: sigma-70 family RNA polymerase sigma factor, partial [Candidatus Nanopelagicales bacterium]|nr:sigma-70 family RNA polymerase sigma factor [Candidatus Nanopelagicales bacterium]
MPEANVEDVVQEALAGAVDARVGVDDKRGELRPWLAGIAWRQASKHLDLAEHRREVVLPEEALEAIEDRAPGPEEQVMARGLREDLLGLLAEIHPVRRRIVVARELRDRDYDEIAAALGMPAATVRNHRRLGLLALRVLCKRRYGGGLLVGLWLGAVLGAQRAWAMGAGRLRGAVGAMAVAVGAVIGIALGGSDALSPRPAAGEALAAKREAAPKTGGTAPKTAGAAPEAGGAAPELRGAVPASARGAVARDAAPHPDMPRPDMPHPDMPRPDMPRPDMPRAPGPASAPRSAGR